MVDVHTECTGSAAALVVDGEEANETLKRVPYSVFNRRRLCTCSLCLRRMLDAATVSMGARRIQQASATSQGGRESSRGASIVSMATAIDRLRDAAAARLDSQLRRRQATGQPL